MEDTKNAPPDPEAQSGYERLPYEKPAVAWEEGLEVRPNLMAGCGKLPGSDPACDTAPGS